MSVAPRSVVNYVLQFNFNEVHMDVGGGGKRSCSRKIAHDLAIYTAPAGSPLHV
jgi:hypothetical protein